eukprot:GEMP01089288.1.p1 GENE.GEMP01089288.1~~GEMP01089288.1.p1  ORF type:complete len:138 (-),score=1.67 GEMP01089288.1:60-473(-)
MRKKINNEHKCTPTLHKKIQFVFDYTKKTGCFPPVNVLPLSSRPDSLRRQFYMVAFFLLVSNILGKGAYDNYFQNHRLRVFMEKRVQAYGVKKSYALCEREKRTKQITEVCVWRRGGDIFLKTKKPKKFRAVGCPLI